MIADRRLGGRARAARPAAARRRPTAASRSTWSGRCCWGRSWRCSWRVTRHWLPPALLLPLARGARRALRLVRAPHAGAGVHPHRQLDRGQRGRVRRRRRLPRRRDVPAAAAPGRLRARHRPARLHPVGVRLVGVALLLCTLGWTAGSMGAARINSRPRNQILLGTAMTFGATVVMAIPIGGAAVPVIAYAFSGLGMGIASPALFAAVLADGGEGREGRSTSSIPLTRQVGSGTGAAVAGIVFAATLSRAPDPGGRARRRARPRRRPRGAPDLPGGRGGERRRRRRLPVAAPRRRRRPGARRAAERRRGRVPARRPAPSPRSAAPDELGRRRPDRRRGRPAAAVRLLRVPAGPARGGRRGAWPAATCSR